MPNSLRQREPPRVPSGISSHDHFALRVQRRKRRKRRKPYLHSICYEVGPGLRDLLAECLVVSPSDFRVNETYPAG